MLNLLPKCERQEIISYIMCNNYGVTIMVTYSNELTSKQMLKSANKFWLIVGLTVAALIVIL